MTEKKKIILTKEQHKDLCTENYLEIDGKEVSIAIMEDQHSSTGRHQEYWTMVFQVLGKTLPLFTGSFFRVEYSNSVKDEMGWDDCNNGPVEAIEVHPVIVTTTKYV